MTLQFPDTNSRHFQILSLAGGGYMGYFTASLLEHIEEKSGPIAEKTDLLAGTSVGSLIALALAANVPAKKISNIMRERGGAIFPTPVFPLLKWFGSIKSAKIDPIPLAQTISDLVGDLTLGDLSHNVIVPAVNMTSGSFRVFKGGPMGNDIDSDVLVSDVALASSAAPIYFPAHPIGGEVFADGGLIANAPDIIAAQTAISDLKSNSAYTRMLSIGTTSKKLGIRSGEDLDWGVKDWVPDILEYSMASQVDLSRYLTQMLLGQENVYVVDPLRSEQQDKGLGLDKAGTVAVSILNGMSQQAFRNLYSDADKAFIEKWYRHEKDSV